MSLLLERDLDVAEPVVAQAGQYVLPAHPMEDERAEFSLASGRTFDIAQIERELDELVTGDWTRLDPYAVRVPRAEGLDRLAQHLERALDRSRRGDGDQPLE